MVQSPPTEAFLLKWRGDVLTVTLDLGAPRAGRAFFRTNLGRASIRRKEIIDSVERGITPLACAWSDIPLEKVAPGRFSADIPLDEVGIFSGKACFFPKGSSVPEWPEGRNLHVKVESAETRANNSIYTVFPRMFGSFRAVIRRLPVIMDEMGFKIVQTLPPFPVPTSYAAMGEYGCPFAATDFLSVDPAMAEFDRRATPLDQFLELVDAVHARRGLFFIDLPANHTGWASTLQTHHPDWFKREQDGCFHSPGAWGVTWEDLVELDYSKPELCAYMADVFLFWCRKGVDGFRCDAGYMIPLRTWEYIVSRVREEYPDTVFMLEGLGGDLAVTDSLLAEANLDWAYSEIFQTYDRRGFEWYLPQAIARSEKYGTLVHFAETHDNDRLAKGGETYARLRVQLAALLSWQGAWGIANGAEWFATEKIDVHGKNDLNWGAAQNMVALIARLNKLLARLPAFRGANHLELVTTGGGNTLAVVRDGLLVLANLDTFTPTEIAWDHARFSAPAAFDLITLRRVATAGNVLLGPGEVLCLYPLAREDAELPSEEELFGSPVAVDGPYPEGPFVQWVWPRDTRRQVCVPGGMRLQVSAPHAFRAVLIDPANGRTLQSAHSRTCAQGAGLILDVPAYAGDGTKVRSLKLELVVYAPERAVRSKAEIIVPPPGEQASVRLALSGEDVRKTPMARTILSNGSGAASQIRLGWGTVASSYDAFLAANPDPNVPADRLVIWTGLRGWLQCEGYSRELDAQCVKRFTADPSGRLARWEFSVPCGMGRQAGFAATVSLVSGLNVARVEVERLDAGPLEALSGVRPVFRPELEWRSFHETTKAFRGPEAVFARAVAVTKGGFSFAPFEGAFAMHVTGGAFHLEPKWRYNVAHPEDAARGLEGSGDLFSPGWISADLAVGERCVLTGAYAKDRTGALHLAAHDYPPYAEVYLPETLPFGEALEKAMDLYIVKRDELKTVIAGYPWFLDWGRDTFIFLRGMIATGRLGDARSILQAFAAFEDRGTLPNIIYGKTAGNRDTSDAPLWFIRCVQELEEASGTADAALTKTCESIVDNYIAGTPNGIRVDAGTGLVWSPAHFTWMDTNYPACTPRVGYPVEIQALWISALRYLKRKALADKARDSVVRYFKADGSRSPGLGYYDCLAAPNGESPVEAVPEDTVRPNQLFLLTLGVLEDASILEATAELLVPGGIRSLNADHPLYRGTYAGDENTSRKPAYHNGTVWAWPLPQYAEALYRIGRVAPEVARQVLTSAAGEMGRGAIGHLSEIQDGDAPHAQKGCAAQAWSVSEMLRVWRLLGSVDKAH